MEYQHLHEIVNIKDLVKEGGSLCDLEAVMTYVANSRTVKVT